LAAASKHGRPRAAIEAFQVAQTRRWRRQLMRALLDPNNDDVSVATLRKAAEAVGQKLKLELVAA
jgi:hypothetical protein